MREYLLFGGTNNHLYYKLDHKNRTEKDLSLQVVYDVFRNNRYDYTLDIIYGILINRGYIVKNKYSLEPYLFELVNKRYIYQINYNNNIFYCDVFTYFRYINNANVSLEKPINFRMPYNDLCLFRNKIGRIKRGILNLRTKCPLTKEHVKGISIISFDEIDFIDGYHLYQIIFDIYPDKKLFLKRNTNFIKTMRNFTGKVDNSRLYYSVRFNLLFNDVR